MKTSLRFKNSLVTPVVLDIVNAAILEKGKR
jgi:hypothetical protein